jgi:predicted ATPase
MNNNINKIVLTGGSCAGKTECLKPIKEHFEKRGYSVYIVNEMATELILGGINPKNIGGNLFQDITVKMQLELEDAYTRAAKKCPNEKSLIILDRAPIDAMAYISLKEIKEIFRKYGTSYEQLLSQYDAVFCLETIAKKFPKMYGMNNNEARQEDLANAISLDDRIRELWCKHRKFNLIEATEKMDVKTKEVINGIEKVLAKKDVEPES